MVERCANWSIPVLCRPPHIARGLTYAVGAGPDLHVLHGGRETLSPERRVRLKITVFGYCPEIMGHKDMKPRQSDAASMAVCSEVF